MLTFVLAVFLLIITPGPGVLSIAGVGAAFGFRAGMPYFLGLFVGTNLVALAVVSGLAAVILAEPVIRALLAGLSAAYLLYLAWRIAFAGTRVAFGRATTRPGVLAGITLQIINPKAYVVYTTLFSGFVLFPQALAAEVGLKFVLFNLIWTPIHFLWLWAGGALKRMEPPEHVQRRINYAMALAMLGVAAMAAATAV